VDEESKSPISLWRVIADNLSTVTTVLTAAVAVVLKSLGLIPDSVMLSVIVGLLALIATSHLVDSRRRLESLGLSLDALIKRASAGGETTEIQRFATTEAAIDYLVAKTRGARLRIDQASIDKQRARKTSARIGYEKAREEVILSNRVQYATSVYLT
jgi:hypothetical protein